MLLGRAKELLRVEKKVMMERAGGKAHYWGSCSRLCSQQNESLLTPSLATSGLAHPVRIRLCGNTVGTPATRMETSPFFGTHKELADRHVDIVL